MRGKTASSLRPGRAAAETAPAVLGRLALLGLAGLLWAVPAGAARAGSAPSGPAWCSRVLVMDLGEARDAEEAPAATAKTRAPELPPQVPSERGELRRVAARWELDLFGPVAIGTLVETFESSSEVELEGFVLQRNPPGASVSSVAVELETLEGESSPGPTGETRALELERPGGQRAASRARGRQAPRVDLGSRTEGFAVPPLGLVHVTSELTLSAGFASGFFELVLPRLTSRCARGRREAEAGQAPDPAPLELLLRLHHDGGTVEVASDGHELQVSQDPAVSRIELASPARAGEELRVRYRVASEDEAPLLSGFVGREREDGTREVLVVLTPPAAPRSQQLRARDVVFVLDTSGSMRGPKLEQARRALEACLDSLDERDAFGIVRFPPGTEALQESLLDVSGGTRLGAADWLAELVAVGGTRLLPALQQAFALPRPEDRDGHPLVVVITDGAIQDETPVLQLLASRPKAPRLLVVGIGAEPSVELIARLAERGRGGYSLAREPDEIVAAMTRLFESFSAPVAWDLALDWGGAEIEELSPVRIPDLYGGRPVTLKARLRGELPESLRLRGSAADGETLEIELPLAGATRHESLRFPERRGPRGPRGR